MNPLVTVIIPVYNAEKYVRQSVESILGQTYQNLEVIVVNDGSTDGSESILRQINDHRVKLFSQGNSGVAAALNKAVESTQGKYIARQDADDISLSTRIEMEVEFLERNPAVGIVGAWAEIIREDGRQGDYLKHSQGNEKLQYDILWNSPFVSSTVMFRKECLVKTGNFYSGKDLFEDYNMWSMIARYFQVSNLPEVLLQYRELHSGLSFMTANSNERLINQRKKNLAFTFPELHSGLIEGLASNGFCRTRLEKLEDLRVMYKLVSDRFVNLQTSGADRKWILNDIPKRLDSFCWLTCGKKNLAYYPARAVEKIVYANMLR